MTAIRSNKALKYNPIQPNEEAIIELKITDVVEFVESKLLVISVQDSTIGDSGKILTVRTKQLTFDEVDQLAEVLQSSGIVLTGSYTEKRLKLLQEGLLYLTKNDPYPIYFSNSEDWFIFNE